MMDKTHLVRTVSICIAAVQQQGIILFHKHASEVLYMLRLIYCLMLVVDQYDNCLLSGWLQLGHLKRKILRDLIFYVAVLIL